MAERKVPHLVFELSERFRRNASFAPVAFEILNPRNLRPSGRATVLLASLTFSCGLSVKNRVIEAMTRSPAR